MTEMTKKTTLYILLPDNEKNQKLQMTKGKSTSKLYYIKCSIEESEVPITVAGNMRIN